MPKPARIATTKGARATTAAQPALPFSTLFYRTHALLESVRAIATHEDELCALLNELKRSRQADETVIGELRELLAEIPVRGCVHDLQRVFAALPGRPAPPRQAPAKRTARPPSTPRKRGAQRSAKPAKTAPKRGRSKA